MAMIKLNFSITINASKERVWQAMFADKTYREWTSAFMPGSYFEGSWETGSPIRFLMQDELGNVGGMLSRIAESKLFEFMGIEHLGMVNAGVDDTESDAAKAFAGAREDYYFSEKNGVTTIRVEQDMSEEYAPMMQEAWPKALNILKALSEA